MTNEQSFVVADHAEGDLYTSCQTRECALNAAIVQADISQSYEEFLDIFDAFYAEDIAMRTETQEQPIRGKARIRSLLADFLVPLHILAEIGGLLVSIQHTPIPSDAADQTHSAWTVELTGRSGRTCTLSWRVLRKWAGSRVTYEYHYDELQRGVPLTVNDLRFDAVIIAAEFRRPS